MKQPSKNIILSRAKSPAIKDNNKLDTLDVNNKEEKILPYFEKKIFHLVNTGFSPNIDKFISSIPQEIKTTCKKPKPFTLEEIKKILN